MSEDDFPSIVPFHFLENKIIISFGMCASLIKSLPSCISYRFYFKPIPKKCLLFTEAILHSGIFSNARHYADISGISTFHFSSAKLCPCYHAFSTAFFFFTFPLPYFHMLIIIDYHFTHLSFN